MLSVLPSGDQGSAEASPPQGGGTVFQKRKEPHIPSHPRVPISKLRNQEILKLPRTISTTGRRTGSAE